MSSIVNALKNFDIWGIIDKIVTIVQSFWTQLNKKMLGNITFWLGLGLLIHDYMVEINDTSINPLRIHGGSFGISLLMISYDFMATGMEWNHLRIKAYLFGYLGLALAWFGWGTRCFPQFIRHIIFWAGVASMVYGWFLLNKEELGLIDAIQNQAIIEALKK